MSVVTWPRPRLRLKHPAQPERAIEVFGERMNELDRLPGKGPSYRHDSPDYVMHRRDCYLDWVELTEIQLSELTYDTAAVVELLHTARYWEIRRLVPLDARPVPLIDAEIRYQKDALNRLRIDLEGRLARARGAALIAVLDTNSLLHYEPPESIPWATIVAHSLVRLVIPLRVIEEVDAKKYSPSRRLRDRARSVLPHIADRVGLWGDSVPLAEGVTLEVLVEPGPRERPEDADEEILDTCRELWDFSGRPEGGVILITNDIAMRLRAEAIGGIKPISLRDEYLRDKDAAHDEE
jgi:hypothetical protein